MESRVDPYLSIYVAIIPSCAGFSWAFNVLSREQCRYIPVPDPLLTPTLEVDRPHAPTLEVLHVGKVLQPWKFLKLSWTGSTVRVF